MEFQLEDGTVFIRPNRATLDHWLRTLSPDGGNSFAVFDLYGLARPEYIQTACCGGAFIIEHRIRDPDHHYRALRTQNRAGAWGAQTDDLFSIEEVIEAFHVFAYGEERTPTFLRWENMDGEVGLGD